MGIIELSDIATASKLKVITAFTSKYPGWVNPYLISIKYCQNDAVAFLEMEFIHTSGEPVFINLDFISDETVEKISPFFKPTADVVDNSMVFVELDTYSLNNCVDGLFTEEAAELI